MRVAITGANGLIGGAIKARFVGEGHEVLSIGRYHAKHPPDIRWSVPHAQLNPAALERLDAVVHLAGEPIVGKWTPAKKQAIRDSRVDGTRLLASTLAGLRIKPSVFISASAIGYYGDRSDEVLTEASEPGEGFLPEVCRAWESAALPAADAGIRVVNPRLGVVLSGKGGALKQMLLPFKLGVGGPLGWGAQWMSWVSLDDVVGAVLYMIGNDAVSGPVNVVSPNPVTNKQYTRTLGALLKRPAVLPLPKFAARLAFGQLADEALYASQRVEPGVLSESGYAFTHPELRSALQAALSH
ncbi:MAG: TIGR01777 family oxidoreductase [Phycisphaerales bacterium]